MNTVNSKFLLASLLIATLSGACAEDDSSDLADASVEASARAHFDLWDSGGQYFFHVVAGNGEVMLSSEGYRDRTGALNGILAVLDNGIDSDRYLIASSRDGEHYVRLKAGNGRIVATSEGYSSLSNARRAIATSVVAIDRYVQRWADDEGARFEVFEAANRQFYFTLFAKNGNPVLRSEGYASEAAALNGAFAVSEVGVDPAAYAVLPAVNGGYYLNLRAGNNQVIATSEVYSTKSNAERSRDAITVLLPEVELL